MQQTISEFTTAVDRLICLHRELLDIENMKLSAILNQDWEELERILIKSREMLSEIDFAETKRIGIVERICGRGDATLSDVERKVTASLRPELRNRGERLVNLIAQQKSLIERIEHLLKSSLEIVNFSLSLLSGSEEAGKTYSQDGQDRGNKGKCSPLVFDIKA